MSKPIVANPEGCGVVICGAQLPAQSVLDFLWKGYNWPTHHMRHIHVALAIFASCYMCGCGTTESMRDHGALGEAGNRNLTYVHPYSMFSFPRTVSAFERVEVHRYDKDGTTSELATAILCR